MRAVFFGTPEFAANILESLLMCHTVSLVITREDKPAGRKRVITPPRVKLLAQEKGIPVFQPSSLKTQICIDELVNANADIFVVAAYGRILPKAVLDLPKYGCINVHASLLPFYRGAAPIQHAIMDGCDETGVSIMRMDEGLDTGDVILAVKTKIDTDDTGGSLTKKLSELGASALLDALKQIEEGVASCTKQDNSKATYAPMITKETCKLDFNNSAKQISNKVRALLPYNMACTTFFGKDVMIVSASDITSVSDAKVGMITDISKKGITVRCGEGALVISKLIPAGGRVMDAYSFSRGRSIKCGDFFI